MAIRVGVTLPQFRSTADPALEAAVSAEANDLDGVFAFDHIWSIGRPDRPALNVWPLLGALAGETSRVHLGPLVARIGLLSDAVLVHNVETLLRMVADRLIVGLGTGDHMSKAENEAVGVPFAPVAERLASLAEVARQIRHLGVPVWIGGRSNAVHEVAAATGSALNLWGAEPASFPAIDDVERTWGGLSPSTSADTAALLRRLVDVGVTWAVLGPPYGTDTDPVPAVEMVAEAVATLR